MSTTRSAIRTLAIACAMAFVAPVALTIVSACNGGGGGGTEPTLGPLQIGIIAGNRQQVQASPTTQLPAPVVGKLVRNPATGQLSFAWGIPAAYGQDIIVLNGSPVPGKVVCASSVGDTLTALIPVVPCANTDSNGQVAFAFRRGSNKVGEPKAVVQGLDNGVVVTFDTARATVGPGPVVGYGGWAFAHDTAVVAGSVIDFNTFPLHAADAYGNIPTVFTFAYQRLNTNPQLNDPFPVTSRLMPVRMGDTLVYAFADTARSGGIHLKVSAQ